ncbi:MAG: LamG domain-containing protein [Kiritimatiellae bacterium]|nr:LamG domain-containing protein [Kiritimatiellia bacterium]
MKSMFTGRSSLPMMALPMLVTALATTNLDADTVAWYHFDEVAQGTPVTSDVRFLNAVDSAKLPGAPYSVGEYGTTEYDVLGSAAAFMPIATNGIADSVYVIDPVSGTKNETGRSLFFRYADHDERDRPARYGGCVQVASDASLSLVDAVTVEFFVLPVRLTERNDNGWHLVSKQSGATSKFTYSICLTNVGVPYVNVYDSDNDLMTTTGNTMFKGTKSILDGKWHHIALTVDGVAAKLYVDYVPQKTVTLTESLHYVDDAPLYIGASQMGWYVPGGFIDEVRISNKALLPNQFLRMKSVNSMKTSFHAGFEGNLDAETAMSIPAFTGVGGMVDTKVSPSLPGFDEQNVPYERIGDRLGNEIRKPNASSVFLKDSTITYPHCPDLESPEMTIEFFMKYQAASNFASIVRFGKSYTNPGAHPVWNIGLNKDASQIMMRIDTTTTENQTREFGDTFLDGEWHHVAVTIAQREGGITLRMYDNYKQVGPDRLLTGSLNYEKGSCLGIGRSSVSNAGFTGWIDELRISRGVLSVDEFMRRGRYGTTVIVR